MIDGNQTLRVEVAHASPGRVRLRIPPEDLESPALRQTERALVALPGVRSVRVNPHARSLVVSYAESVGGPADLLRAVWLAGIAIVPATGTPVVPVARSFQPSTESSSHVVSQDIAKRWGRYRLGVARLRMIVPAVLVAVVIRAITTGGQISLPWYLLAAVVIHSFLKSPEAAKSSM